MHIITQVNVLDSSIIGETTSFEGQNQMNVTEVIAIGESITFSTYNYVLLVVVGDSTTIGDIAQILHTGIPARGTVSS